ncbi:diguanylate cyclase (GGDEF)-like protein [Labrenzia sp. EL_208]|uniref:Diguanylate cyclase/phosphodiesterase n=3 Tax=cellular organisms TaxID=131567 RepID=A0AA36HIT7_9DINO|nr:EAL domain-containing protein [Roseibium album]MBG6145097.1 diguanylate cyclase (GGDEF)-like protein [Labrenzia sp. EL_142]MBG6155050.1 diguanylate cyclase (GGDEF)-like protein [Labrenzia sp. EL_162]MBG6162310.1 diguanylate cyclase (GGDEF)-like protein [Labrenzia sp. EL_195]MBG6173970.1 diguanylate cyclase (GGDEF)-like protein [Labrenzia sp. EL_132]MBG6192820.1 diguanylate cyclase (GGDEF)-like protein [Labrenzia sp. EL_159]MBG6199207.1 diguanylate cyclase (GGDEF)-like protein [Labrenzia sp
MMARPLAALFAAAIVSFAALKFIPHLLEDGHDENNHLFYDAATGIFMVFALVGTTYGIWATRRLRKELSARSSQHSEALALAQHDALTGLPNRRRLLEAFAVLSREVKDDCFRAIMMLDLDGFKPINDVYGHAFGDNLLRSFAGRLAETVGNDGIVARLGGDEFAIISPVFKDKSEASGFARRLLTRISERFEFGERQISIGTGIGIALYPHDGHAITELLRRADIALYRAKSSGRSTYRFFEVDMDASILHRTLLEQRLRRAIENEEVKVHYQPILDMDTGRIAGFEGLARWSDSDFGDVPPMQFIPIAEDCGIISELTRHLLAQACSAARSWPDELYLSFNLSPVQLQDPALPTQIQTILDTAGYPADRLVLEITETSLVKNPESAKRILNELTKAGITIALDDFGAGHSSLSYLRDFPIKKVKIDKSFTERMLTDKQCAAIVEAVLVLSRGLDIDAVAEGVEQGEVHDALSSSGCHYGQGFLYAKAVSAEAAAELLNDQADGSLSFSDTSNVA